MLGPLAVASLALLQERPMHPYEMYQLLIARSEDRLLKVRPDTLYHAIDRLAQEGLVRALTTGRAGNRPERTTYEVTSDGTAAMREWLRATLAHPVNEYPRFPIAVGEAHNLPRDEVVGLLRTRVDVLHADAEFLGSALHHLQHRPVEERYWLDVPYQRAQLTAEIDWLERLIARLEAGEIPWPDPSEGSPNTTKDE